MEWAPGVAEPRAGSEEREGGSLTRWMEPNSWSHCRPGRRKQALDPPQSPYFLSVPRMALLSAQVIQLLCQHLAPQVPAGPIDLGVLCLLEMSLPSLTLTFLCRILFPSWSSQKKSATFLRVSLTICPPCKSYSVIPVLLHYEGSQYRNSR